LSRHIHMFCLQVWTMSTEITESRRLTLRFWYNYSFQFIRFTTYFLFLSFSSIIEDARCPTRSSVVSRKTLGSCPEAQEESYPFQTFLNFLRLVHYHCHSTPHLVMDIPDQDSNLWSRERQGTGESFFGEICISKSVLWWRQELISFSSNHLSSNVFLVSTNFSLRILDKEIKK
jgi:hypothetical protein